jgi:hypothetical protein
MARKKKTVAILENPELNLYLVALQVSWFMLLEDFLVSSDVQFLIGVTRTEKIEFIRDAQIGYV